MRRLLVPLILIALLVPSASARDLQRGDGTLSIRDGRGTVVVHARGAVIGQVARFERNGRLILDDLVDGDGSEPRVLGADWSRLRADGTPIYGGKNIRFRLIGGRFALRLTNAVGLQLSVVGRGNVTLDGAGSVTSGVGFDGTFSLNGEPAESLPDDTATFPIRPPVTLRQSRRAR
jgi:hypothetical protein